MQKIVADGVGHVVLRAAHEKLILLPFLIGLNGLPRRGCESAFEIKVGPKQFLILSLFKDINEVVSGKELRERMASFDVSLTHDSLDKINGFHQAMARMRANGWITSVKRNRYEMDYQLTENGEAARRTIAEFNDRVRQLRVGL